MFLAVFLMLSQIPDLKALQWVSRVLILSSVAPEDPLLQAQRDLLKGQEAAMVERDLKVYEVVGQTDEIRHFRRKLGLTDGHFAVILVGKDGSRKLTRRQPVTPVALFSKVDSMPMRRDEMKRSEVH